MTTGRTAPALAPPPARPSCSRCGQALPADEAYDDVESNGDGSEHEILVHFACATPERQRQIVHDVAAAGSDPEGKLWAVLGPEEREIVLAMLKRDELEIRERIVEVFRASLDAGARAAWDERELLRSNELRAKALRAVGLPAEADPQADGRE
jgi:hypothetical protein